MTEEGRKYQLKLSNFEGPLDLLLHLISKAKIEPKDIFVSEVTEQYLSYMEGIDALNLDTASDFIQMAAALIYIKSRSLLPEKRREEDLDEEGLTPEEQIVARLNEYRRFKEIAKELAQLESEGRLRQYKLPEELLPGQQEISFSNAQVQALAEAYQRVLEKIKKRQKPSANVVIYRDGYSVRVQTKTILARLTIKRRVSFEELLSKEPCREEVAVTFLALLELLHLGTIQVSQQNTFGKIAIEKRTKKKV